MSNTPIIHGLSPEGPILPELYAYGLKMDRKRKAEEQGGPEPQIQKVSLDALSLNHYVERMQIPEDFRREIAYSTTRLQSKDSFPDTYRLETKNPTLSGKYALVMLFSAIRNISNRKVKDLTEFWQSFRLSGSRDEDIVQALSENLNAVEITTIALTKDSAATIVDQLLEESPFPVLVKVTDPQTKAPIWMIVSEDKGEQYVIRTPFNQKGIRYVKSGFKNSLKFGEAIAIQIKDKEKYDL